MTDTVLKVPGVSCDRHQNSTSNRKICVYNIFHFVIGSFGEIVLRQTVFLDLFVRD